MRSIAGPIKGGEGVIPLKNCMRNIAVLFGRVEILTITSMPFLKRV